MFKNWSSWLGAEKESGEVTEEPADANEEKRFSEINKPSDQQGRDAGTDAQLLQKAKGFSGYIYNFASSASKKLSESVVETAQTLKKSVEEGKISGIIDKTILGDFQKEQERFVQEKRAKEYGAAVPPWVGYNEEDAIQEQILALSAVNIFKKHFIYNRKLLKLCLTVTLLHCFRIKEIFCVTPLLGCSFTLTLTKCIQSPWLC